VPSVAVQTTTTASDVPCLRGHARRRDRVVVVRLPPVVLREQLAVARRARVSFDQAWPAALKATVNASQWERAEWLEVLSGVVEAWRAGWERRPATGSEEVLAALVMPGGVPLPERACEHCGGEIPPERGTYGVPARFCVDRCRRRATYLRERERAAA
jgi:hypothetical protein